MIFWPWSSWFSVVICVNKLKYCTSNQLWKYQFHKLYAVICAIDFLRCSDLLFDHASHARLVVSNCFPLSFIVISVLSAYLSWQGSKGSTGFSSVFPKFQKKESCNMFTVSTGILQVFPRILTIFHKCFPIVHQICGLNHSCFTIFEGIPCLNHFPWLNWLNYNLVHMFDG